VGLVLVVVGLLFGGAIGDGDEKGGGVGDGTTITGPTDQRKVTKVSRGPWSASVGGLTMTVERVTLFSDHSLELTTVVDNETGTSLSLPLYGNLGVTDDRANSYDVDPFHSKWNDTFASGQRTRGTIRIGGPPPAGAKTLTIAFAHVVGSFSIDSIRVAGIRLP
jgi:hypothetical protein